MNYTKFRGGVSTGKCVIIDPNHNGKWDADDCQDENKYFICERIKGFYLYSFNDTYLMTRI